MHQESGDDITFRKDEGRFKDLKLLLCKNPLPPLDEAIEAAKHELPRSNHYTEAYSAPLRRLLDTQIGSFT